MCETYSIESDELLGIRRFVFAVHSPMTSPAAGTNRWFHRERMVGIGSMPHPTKISISNRVEFRAEWAFAQAPNYDRLR